MVTGNSSHRQHGGNDKQADQVKNESLSGSNAEGASSPENGASGLISSEGWDPSTPTGEPRSSESADRGKRMSSGDEERQAPRDG